MRKLSLLFLLLLISKGYSQENLKKEDDTNIKIDSLYREDQFYFGFTFNSLQNKPAGFDMNGISTGLLGGFVRDMPINKSRTVAFATGFGLAYNKYKSNLGIAGNNENPEYILVPKNNSYKNKFAQLLIEMPIEFRWRTSTFESHKFWRIYSGVKLSYLVYDHSEFTYNSQKVSISNNTDFNKLLYGAYISAGFNTWNIYAYYGLNSLFKSGDVNGNALKLNPMNIGICFFIL